MATAGAGNCGGRQKQRQQRGQTTINQRVAVIVAVETAVVEETKTTAVVAVAAVAAAVMASMAVPTAAKAAPTAAKAVGDETA